VKLPARMTLAPPEFAGAAVSKDVTGLTSVARRERPISPSAGRSPAPNLPDRLRRDIATRCTPRCKGSRAHAGRVMGIVEAKDDAWRGCAVISRHICAVLYSAALALLFQCNCKRSWHFCDPNSRAPLNGSGKERKAFAPGAIFASRNRNDPGTRGTKGSRPVRVV
jgi:hypothetical protein